jgi:hypothetical protein
METAPKRRWLRFSLRTMFVAFTGVAVWLGWNLHIVRLRRAAIEAWSERWSPSNVTVWTVTAALEKGPLYGEKNPIIPQVPWIRHLLGDEAVSTVILTWDVTEDARISVRELSPEATVEELAKPFDAPLPLD